MKSWTKDDEEFIELLDQLTKSFNFSPQRSLLLMLHAAITFAAQTDDPRESFKNFVKSAMDIEEYPWLDTLLQTLKNRLHS